MKPIVEHVRLSSKAKEILLRIKKRTGVEHWNELCRAALCRSLAEPSRPTPKVVSGDVAIDMEWKTFGGVHQNVFSALVLTRAAKDGIDVTNPAAIAEYFSAHLERGVSSLNNVKSLSDLATRAMS